MSTLVALEHPLFWHCSVEVEHPAMVEQLLDWNCDGGDASRDHDDPVTLDASGDSARAQLPMGTAFPYAGWDDNSSCDGLAAE